MGIIVPPLLREGSTPVVDTPTSVYRYYDQHGLLLYVGVTSRGIQRNREHNTTKEWWPYVVSQQVDHHATRGRALAAERHLIQTFHPPFNTQHNPESHILRAAYLGLSVQEASPTRKLKRLKFGLSAVPIVRLTEKHERYVLYRTELADYEHARFLVFKGSAGVQRTAQERIGWVAGLHFKGVVAVLHLKVTPRSAAAPTATLFFRPNNNDGPDKLRVFSVGMWQL
jgi:hypothetical protein